MYHGTVELIVLDKRCHQSGSKRKSADNESLREVPDARATLFQDGRFFNKHNRYEGPVHVNRTSLQWHDSQNKGTPT